MKRLVLAVVAGTLAALAMAAPSTAADLPRKAPIYSAPVSYDWTGFYLGINAEYGWGRSNWNFNNLFTSDFNVKGALVGGTAGYNMQSGAYVFGLEGDIAYSAIKGSDPANCGDCDTRNRWLATARGRLGYAFDRILPYVTAGGAFGDVKMTPAPGGASETKTRVGWTAGAGVEYAFLGAWSAKVEYLYADLGKASCSTATCGVPTDVKFKTNLVRAGVNYRF